MISRQCIFAVRLAFTLAILSPSWSVAQTLPTLEKGAAGKHVETLQRTLNARLRPSPRLSIDGDFGDATQAALVRFQRAKKLPVTGRVTKATWTALGKLVTADPPVPSPEAVNKTRLPRQPADTLDGPPFVTCQAWAIADAKTGKVLWSHQANERRHIASTTKIMTAYVVLKLAQGQPKIMDEVVEFSRRADETRGSSARIRAGERLPVRHLLYGLLLPSGNDASVALAEHFGHRLAKAAGDKTKDPLPAFVAAMNRTAAALKMTHTHYENPHGLTSTKHLSSARDLTILARAAFQMATFRKYVGRRLFGCELIAKDGSKRNTIWKNTNRLLPISGYDGVKTGTTSAAGACLVASGHRADRHLFVVVLKSVNSDARYVDTRNLFRWGWQQFAKQNKAGVK